MSKAVFAQTTIEAEIILSDTSINAGDTLYCFAEVKDSSLRNKAMSLNVWIEDVTHLSRWQLRYPVIEGIAEMALVFPEQIGNGHYAIHCEVRPVFFDLLGVINGKYKKDSIAFTMIDHNRNILYGNLKVWYGNQFRLGKLLFEETSYIFFSEYGKRNSKLANVEIILPLDSATASLYDTTFMITVGNPEDDDLASSYRFETDVFLNPKGTLENVTITANRKTKIDLLEEEYVRSGLFNGGNSIIFDGDDPVLRSSFDVLTYLQGRVPGLLIGRDSNGLPTLTWRAAATTTFLDEMMVDPQTLSMIPATDIAMIKVFRPPFFGAFGGGPGGAVAIYTRRGSSLGEVSSGGFVVNGYTPMLYTLPVRD